jgi:hypothetical protein
MMEATRSFRNVGSNKNQAASFPRQQEPSGVISQKTRAKRRHFPENSIFDGLRRENLKSYIKNSTFEITWLLNLNSEIILSLSPKLISPMCYSDVSAKLQTFLSMLD